MKKCRKCNIEKDHSDFHKLNRNKDGLQPVCRSCKRGMDVIRNNKPEIKARQLQHNKNNRDDRRLKLTEYMKDKSCSICGESHRACLQFHHIDDKQKEFTVADAVRGAISWKKILNEINKCDILCANCHAKETAIQQGWYKI